MLCCVRGPDTSHVARLCMDFFSNMLIQWIFGVWCPNKGHLLHFDGTSFSSSLCLSAAGINLEAIFHKAAKNTDA